MLHLTVRPKRPPSAKREETEISENFEYYARAVVQVHLPSGPIHVEPAEAGTTSGAYPTEAGERPICIITAHNPRGVTKAEGANRRLHRDLVNWLDAEGLTHYPAAGGDREWQHIEESVAIVGIDVNQAREIGRIFAQDAVFVWTAAAWQVVGCEDDTVVSLGWTTPAPSEELVKIDAAYRALRLESPYVPKHTVHAALEHATSEAALVEVPRLNGHYLDLVRAEYARQREERRQAAERDERLRAERRAALQAAEEAERQAVKARAERERAEEAERREQRRRHRAERAERARAAREAERAQHEADVASGWPEAWKPKQVRRWRELGGERATALAFAEKGWPADAALDAARSLGSAAGLVPPAERHTHHADFGDSLGSVLSAEWPAAPAAAVLSMRRRVPSGRRERWFVVRIDDVFEVEAHVCRRAGSWRSRSVGRWSSLEEAVRGVPTLRNVHPDAQTVYRTPALGVDELAALLRVPARGRAEAVADGLDPAHRRLGEDVDDGYPWPSDSDLIHLLESAGVDVRRIDVQLNGVGLAAARLGRRWQWVHVGTWEWDDELPRGEDVAECRWFTESGGAPISWDGGNSLKLLAPGLLLDRQWGDMGAELSIVRWPVSAAGRARLLAEWIERLEVELPAALVLEDWPREDQWMDWYAVEIALWFDVSAEVITRLRRRLARNATYRAARHAVRHPRSVLGRKLAVALSEATETGFTGDLYGRWLDVRL